MAEEKKDAAAEAPAEAAADDAVQKKGDKGDGGGQAFNPKLLFIFLGLNSVILVVIAALFVMQYSKRSQEVSLADVAASSEGEHGGGGHGEAKEGGGEHGGEKKEGAEGADNFIKETFTVNLKDSKGAHYAKLNVEIEIDDDFVREEVKKQIPRIRDFIVVTLSSKTYEQVESVDGREFLREDIRNKINGYLTRGQIKNVYFTEFIIQ